MLQRARGAAAVAACLVVAAPTPTAAELGPPVVVRLDFPSGAAGFGVAVAALGDVDTDGVPDAAVGAPGSGHMYILSGSTRTVLADVNDPAGAGFDFGRAIAAVGDVDGDGVPDLTVGAPSASSTVAGPCSRSGSCPSASAAAGRAVVVSGSGGAVLRELAPATGDDATFGSALAGPGDLSGDNVPDVVVGAPGSAKASGVVRAFSAVDGRVLWSRVEPAEGRPAVRSFGAVVVATSDASGDGVADLLVSAPAETYGGEPGGRVHLLSGLDGAVIRTMFDPAPHEGDVFGACTAAIGDQDADGVTDHLVGEGGSGHLHLYSGVDGTPMRSFSPPVAASGPGGCVLAPVDDRDGDGLVDFWVAKPSARTVSLLNGSGSLLASTTGPSMEGAFGASASGVGDLDGDAKTDLVVGDPSEPGGGAAYLVYTGRDGEPVKDFESGADSAGLRGPDGVAGTTAEPLDRAGDPLAGAGTTTDPISPTTVPSTTTVPTESRTARLSPASAVVTEPEGAAAPAPSTEVAPRTATLPKPPGITPAARGGLARTGGAGGPTRLLGSCALALGALGLVLGRRAVRPFYPGGDR